MTKATAEVVGTSTNGRGLESLSGAPNLTLFFRLAPAPDLRNKLVPPFKLLLGGKHSVIPRGTHLDSQGTEKLPQQWQT